MSVTIVSQEIWDKTEEGLKQAIEHGLFDHSIRDFEPAVLQYRRHQAWAQTTMLSTPARKA